MAGWDSLSRSQGRKLKHGGICLCKKVALVPLNFIMPPQQGHCLGVRGLGRVVVVGCDISGTSFYSHGDGTQRQFVFYPMIATNPLSAPSTAQR